MPPSHHPGHFVVDGSNIATEGRSVPSLAQLNEAVLAFAAEHPDTLLTVVVDATFGHRIDKSEVAEFDEAVANNELVAPPAGAIGRGDAFVLTIADKAGAGVLSNDSFQEFHGQYDWLFDEGRLVGGKPVPYVGWVFVDRTPVRGPKSRQSVKQAKSGRGRSAKGAAKQAATSPEEAIAAKEQAKARIRPKAAVAAAAPDDQSAPSGQRDKPRARKSGGRSRRSASGAVAETETTAVATATEAPLRDGFVNDLMPFLDFVAGHSVGSSCEGVIETYASHGAYARVDDVAVYLPLRLMGTPPPRSARSVVKVGDPVTMEIVGYVPDRRSIDAALVATSSVAAAPTGDDENAVATPVEPSNEIVPESATSTGAVGRTGSKSHQKKAAAKKAAAKQSAAKKAGAKKSAPKKAAAKKSAASKAAAKTADAHVEPSDNTRSATKTATAKKTPVKKAAAKKAAAKKKAADKKTAPSDLSKAAVKKTAAKKSAARKAAASAARKEEGR